jgi:Protein of unknown function (DUF3300).
MRRTITFCLLSCLVANVTLAAHAASGRRASEASTAAFPQGVAALSAEQIDNLLAPIALYPDPLLAQVFPASTFVDQNDDLDRPNNDAVSPCGDCDDLRRKSSNHYCQLQHVAKRTVYMAQAILNYPKKNVVVQIDNANYHVISNSQQYCERTRH